MEGDTVLSVAGDPAHPVTQGFICPKMHSYGKTVHSPGRLTTPLLRTGKKGEGRFTPISWEEAIQRVCETWQNISMKYGTEAILPYSYGGTMGMVQRNAGHAFFHYLGASQLERTICSAAKGAGWSTVMGETPGMQPEEILQSDLVILWGINAAATSIHTMRDALLAKRQGAKIWVIDTYMTATAELADEVFLLKPGSDTSLVLGMMHVLVRDNLTDTSFISENVLGYQELTQTVLSDCSPEKMSVLTGIPSAVIERMASQYAAAEAPFIRLGNGLSRYGNGAMAVRSITCLPSLTGAWTRSGGGVFGGTSTGAAFAMHKIVRPDFMKQSTRVINMNQLGAALSGTFTPPVHSLYVYHANPALVSPDQCAIHEGLRREDLFTVVHERFMTDTARFADIVLPATTSLEHDDLYRSYGHYCAQLGKAIIAPVGQAKSNWQVFQMLAEGMGWNEPFFTKQATDLIGELLADENAWRDKGTNERLQQGKAVVLNVPTDPKSQWLTPSGKIEILNVRESEPLPRILSTHAAYDSFPLLLQSAPSRYSLNSTFYEQDGLRAKQAVMCLLMHPEDAEVRELVDGQQVTAFNDYGSVRFTLSVSERTIPGTVVTEGLWWLDFVAGENGVNALMSQRLTDKGNGATLYDVAVEVQGDKEG